MQRPPGLIPRADRNDVFLSGTALLPNGREIKVWLLDVSQDGCRLKTEETLMIGDEILVTTAALEPLCGKVRWSLLDMAGLHFLNGDRT